MARFYPWGAPHGRSANATMALVFKRAIPVSLVLVVLAAPGAAAAADTVVAPGAQAQRLTALDGTIVWVTGTAPRQRLVQRTAAGIAPVKGAPVAAYRSIDLGRDRRNRLVLTYLRCGTGAGCRVYRDDLLGRRASIRGLTRRCEVSSAPALWRERIAYGLACHTGSGRTKRADPRRSGLYVKTRSGSPKRLPRPRDAVRFGVHHVPWVDLRGTRVAALAADIYQYAFSQTTGGSRRQSFLAAASEGETTEHVGGLALGSGSVLWTLVRSEHTGDPSQAVIFRHTGGCLDSEAMVNPRGPDEATGFRADALAVDGRTLYLSVPGTGIVAHGFTPDRTCAPG
ncbi:MAG: hypothetical protein H0T43_02630 [Solirubrobacterales bacterium]|nr:hypothetical protein [Solirubrobacterales bacterium]